LKRFKNILLVCDEASCHDALIDRAIWLARSNGARLTLADVVDLAPREFSALLQGVDGAASINLEKQVLKIHQERLDHLADRIKCQDIPTEAVVLQGTPFIELIRKVLRDYHDLVLKGGEIETGRRSLGFASTDLHLMRKCPCPVWTIKEGDSRRYDRILAAVDPDPSDERKTALNKMIMDLATSLCRIDDAELHVVNAWRLREENTLRNSGFTRTLDIEVDLLVELKREQSEGALESLLGDYPANGSTRKVHLLKGSPRDKIPELARSTKAGLIVMGTVGRTGLPGLFIGNAAESILNQVECSVLTVKPPGFETPVHTD
jgi:nucleotide-binding universal stress UspA family protein